MTVKRRIAYDTGIAALRALSHEPSRQDIATAVRYLLEELAEIAPGNAVEVRVPPFGAAQCVAGPRHTRGTPPNVVEMEPEVWIELATGKETWEEALRLAKVTASGSRADLSRLLPIMKQPES